MFFRIHFLVRLLNRLNQHNVDFCQEKKKNVQTFYLQQLKAQNFLTSNKLFFHKTELKTKEEGGVDDLSSYLALKILPLLTTKKEVSVVFFWGGGGRNLPSTVVDPELEASSQTNQ